MLKQAKTNISSWYKFKSHGFRKLANLPFHLTGTIQMVTFRQIFFEIESFQQIMYLYLCLKEIKETF